MPDSGRCPVLCFVPGAAQYPPWYWVAFYLKIGIVILTLARKPQIRINNGIFAKEVRVISDARGNLGVLATRDAIKEAESEGLDLIEISPDARPPVAKITDWGKYVYDQKKKQKEIKAKTKNFEVKSVQIKIGTSDNDVSLKAKRASDWLDEGHRVKVELFLRGRSKYMEKGFLEDRLNRFLTFMKVPYKLVDDIKKSPKGIMVTIELDKSKNTPATPTDTQDQE